MCASPVAYKELGKHNDLALGTPTKAAEAAFAIFDALIICKKRYASFHLPSDVFFVFYHNSVFCQSQAFRKSIHECRCLSDFA
jgi:hypothetical protein